MLFLIKLILTPVLVALMSLAARAWGPTDVAITYDPPVKDPSEIAVEREANADGPDLFVCWMQKAPARQLVNLKNIPVMVNLLYDVETGTRFKPLNFPMP